jgi:hypothetical protein
MCKPGRQTKPWSKRIGANFQLNSGATWNRAFAREISLHGFRLAGVAFITTERADYTGADVPSAAKRQERSG